MSDKIVSTLKDGDTIVEHVHTEVVGSGLIHLTIQMPILRHIDKVITCHVVETDPATSTGAITHVKVAGTVIGMTLEAIGATTTLVVNIAAIGF